MSFTCSYLCSCYAGYKFWTAFQRGSSPTLSVWGGNTSQYQSNILAASCRHPHLNRDRSVLVDVRGFVIGCILRDALHKMDQWDDSMQNHRHGALADNRKVLWVPETRRFHWIAYLRTADKPHVFFSDLAEHYTMFLTMLSVRAYVIRSYVCLNHVLPRYGNRISTACISRIYTRWHVVNVKVLRDICHNCAWCVIKSQWLTPLGIKP